MTRYRCVDAQTAGFPVTRACETTNVSTSAYYAWTAQRDQQPLTRQRRDTEVLETIRDIHREHPDYGSPRVTKELASGSAAQSQEGRSDHGRAWDRRAASSASPWLDHA